MSACSCSQDLYWSFCFAQVSRKEAQSASTSCSNDTLLCRESTYLLAIVLSSSAHSLSVITTSFTSIIVLGSGSACSGISRGVSVTTLSSTSPRYFSLSPRRFRRSPPPFPSGTGSASAPFFFFLPPVADGVSGTASDSTTGCGSSSSSSGSFTMGSSSMISHWMPISSTMGTVWTKRSWKNSRGVWVVWERMNPLSASLRPFCHARLSASWWLMSSCWWTCKNSFSASALRRASSALCNASDMAPRKSSMRLVVSRSSSSSSLIWWCCSRVALGLPNSSIDIPGITK
mmetsp:Transcript_5841/g.13293  ORF Transcript_5841/g.13293 Transcript_5841/m.13293 type:complete len:288 (-) Transcript_5841:175-1038(-)